MDAKLAQAVRNRAKDACEYCLLPQSIRRLRFQVEHIVSRQHGGTTDLENLALACGRCNRHKGPNVAGIDPESRQLTRLFNPRIDRWSDHFRFAGAVVLGLTAMGRATVSVLAMNHPDDIAVRFEMIDEGVFPPAPPT